MAVIPEIASSGLKTADAAIKAGPGTLVGFTVLTDGTNTATLILYDNPSAASGTVLGKMIVVGADRFDHIEFSSHRLASTGIYADVTGTGAEYIVYYI